MGNRKHPHGDIPEYEGSHIQRDVSQFYDQARFFHAEDLTDVLESGDGCVLPNLQTDCLPLCWLSHVDNVAYLHEEELSAQLKMLPTPDEVSTVVSQLEIDDLKEFAASIMNATVDSAHKGNADLDTIRLLNGWFASMEETIAAGDDLKEVLSRRWTPQGDLPIK